MTKKDYEIIAKVLREESRHTACEKTIVAGIANRLAVAMLRDNPSFKPARFLKACGVEDATKVERAITSDGRACTCGARKANGVNVHRAGCAYYAELPEGVTLMSLAAGPRAIHAAIKEAVGE